MPPDLVHGQHLWVVHRRCVRRRRTAGCRQGFDLQRAAVGGMWDARVFGLLLTAIIITIIG
jgi:hypothetical protein